METARDIGTNCAGETAGQVANYLLADLRVFLRASGPGATTLLDTLDRGIAAAIRESAARARTDALTKGEERGGA